MEDGNVQALRPNNTEAAVGVAQHQHSIRLQFDHQVIGFSDDVAHGLPQRIANSLQKNIRRSQI